MTKWTLPLTAVCLAALCTHSFAQPSRYQIKRIIKSALKQSKQPIFTGIVIQSMKTGKILYQKNAANHFMPASTLKLVTATAALEYLKPNYRYNTWLLTDAKQLKGPALKGNLWVKFEGDPSLKRKQLNTLLANLKKRGISRINGHVYVDSSAYDDIKYAPGWIWDDLSYAYAAPTSAVVLNKNKFLLKITPAKNIGQRVRLNAKKMPAGIIHYNNQLVTVNQVKNCPVAIYNNQNNGYLIKGCFQKNWGVQHRLLAVTDPVLYARQLIKQQLHELKIQYKGRVGKQPAPKNTVEIAVHASPPLSQLAIKMLKKSDNLIADAFLKTMGQRYYKTQGTWQNGVEAMQKILAPITGINFKNTLITDGAGLSRYNLITPMQLAKLLNFAYHDLEIEPELLAAMPIAGKDGTLEYRMRSLKHPRNVRGKTGTMSGVSGLAGYLTTTHKDVLSYVILINNFVGKVREYRKIEDRICIALTGQKGSKG
ncbi:MAG: D-alanyl-D-alanine carboxypeptidase/D-alanyl-D-alanine-endopeptidase [Coxiellaceae bacterium]|nr:D-alanyl-D-alanine carboxypeptidase/D-alanyl-D-alanine-endopeptidase [Coxiellaceae bacterium]